MNVGKSPFEKDDLEGVSDTKETPIVKSTLSEKDFIKNKPFLNTFPFWFWPFLFAIAVLIILGVQRWYYEVDNKLLKDDPFMQVTNRELSVFLWQFPSFLRVNVSKKTGYLPAFYFDRENFDPSLGENYVIAPPDLIFLYHTWKRLISENTPTQVIDPFAFNNFLARLTEWQPGNWENAPDGYRELIRTKNYENIKDMRILTELELPLIVRQAFQGWRNYFEDGVGINQLTVTVLGAEDFLKNYPYYARPFWRNIDLIAGQKIAGLNYLSSLSDQDIPKTSLIFNEQLSPFLKVAIFNSQKELF